MNIMGVREFAKAPGVGEPPVPRRTPAEPTVNDTTPPKPDLGVPTYGNLPDRVPTAGQRVQIIENGGKYFERDYETGALTQASGEYAFARMPDGSLWESRYGHAEASMGGRVAYAGQVKFENGALKEWSGASGTYRPVGGDFANQAGFNAPPQPIPDHPGKKVQLPVFQEPPGSVIIPPKVDKSLDTAGGAPHASEQPKVIVDRSAYTVEPGQAGMSKALGLDPSKTRVVALASDGHVPTSTSLPHPSAPPVPAAGLRRRRFQAAPPRRLPAMRHHAPRARPSGSCRPEETGLGWSSCTRARRATCRRAVSPAAT